MPALQRVGSGAAGMLYLMGATLRAMSNRNPRKVMRPSFRKISMKNRVASDCAAVSVR